METTSNRAKHGVYSAKPVSLWLREYVAHLLGLVQKLTTEGWTFLIVIKERWLRKPRCSLLDMKGIDAGTISTDACLITLLQVLVSSCFPFDATSF